MTNPICQLLSIEYPIIQAGMVYASSAKLAAASANAGFLGVLGAGSMSLELLRTQIRKAKQLSAKSLAINIPLLYSKNREQLELSLEEGIKIFVTSAGSPKTYTQWLKDQGAVVIHVCSTPDLAKKCEDAGVDAVVAEGFEAGGHNGRDELTTMVLIPQVVLAVKIPVIAAGGIVNGAQIVAALALGAQAVQMGTRFLATQESSAHENFKQKIIHSSSTSTFLRLKSLVPVRLLDNEFSRQVAQMEKSGSSVEDLEKLLGMGRARAGMLDGDINQGELEVGQAIGLVRDIPSVTELKIRLLDEVKMAKLNLNESLHSCF